jgi:hypothetical protein
MVAPPIRAPMIINEALIEKHFARDPITRELVADDVLGEMAAAMKAARVGAEQMAEVHASVSANTSMLPDARTLQIRKTVTTLGERAAARLDGARSKALAELDRLRRETSAPPVPGNQLIAALEAESRSALRSMGAKHRGRVIHSAIENGDDVVVGAILRGPPMLSGLTDAEREMRRSVWRKKRHPGVLDREERLGRAVAALERGGSGLIALVADITDSPSAKRAAATAAAAHAAIEAAAGASP